VEVGELVLGGEPAEGSGTPYHGTVVGKHDRCIEI
jgi:hypothetical protein